MSHFLRHCTFLLTLLLVSCSDLPEYDVVIRNGLVYDGRGQEPRIADVALIGDSIAAVGEKLPGKVALEIDATGLAVSPGFINMLSWANESLLQDGRSLQPERRIEQVEFRAADVRDHARRSGQVGR